MLTSLAYLIYAVADVYSTVLIIYVLMSWIPMGGGIVTDVYHALGKICDPFLDLFRRFIPPIGGMVDVSPIVALLVLQFGVRLIVNFLAVLI